MGMRSHHNLAPDLASGIMHPDTITTRSIRREGLHRNNCLGKNFETMGERWLHISANINSANKCNGTAILFIDTPGKGATL
jgi:hypothetical protein